MKHRIKHGVKNYIKMSFADSVALIKMCGPSLLMFELLYKLSSIAVIYPLFLKGFDFTLSKAGFKYLTNTYVLQYIKSPYTIIFFLLVLIFFAFYITYEVSCLTVAFDAAYHGNTLSVADIFRSGARLMNKTMKVKRINTFFHVLSVSVMMNITVMIFFILNITFPSSVMRWIDAHRTFIIIMGLLFLAYFIYCMLHIFIINYMAYDGADITESKKRSRNLLKSRGIKTFLVMIGWNGIILLGIFIVYWILVGLIWLGTFILDKANFGMAIYLTIFRGILNISKILMVMVTVPLSYGVITGLFFRYRADFGTEANMGDITEQVDKRRTGFVKLQYFVSIIVVAVSLFFDISYMVQAFEKNPFSKVEMFSNTMVMAHRGSSYDAPENTMLAFDNAISAMADYIELDVHETKDGEIVVLHDDSLKRTTGVNKKIWNVTYNDIKDWMPEVILVMMKNLHSVVFRR